MIPKMNELTEELQRLKDRLTRPVIEIRENVNRPAWTQASLTGTTPRTVKLPGTTLGLDDTLTFIEREQHEHTTKS